MIWYEKISLKNYFLIGLGIIVLAALALFLMGRIPICECGYVKLWHGNVASSENSQHLSDWYTFSHVIHGFAFYWIFWKLGKKFSKSGAGWPLGLHLILAIAVESAWEIFENTDFVINRYREATISLDYYGDSVLNSAMDILFMVLGFFAAGRLPVWLIIAFTVFMEIGVAYFIRDNLTLNIIMLIYPFEFIKTWQANG